MRDLFIDTLLRKYSVRLANMLNTVALVRSNPLSLPRRFGTDLPLSRAKFNKLAYEGVRIRHEHWPPTSCLDCWIEFQGTHQSSLDVPALQVFRIQFRRRRERPIQNLRFARSLDQLVFPVEQRL